MKQLKNWSILMLMVMAMPLMVACGSDGDSGPSGDDLKSKAIGTWMCTQSTDEAQGRSYSGLMVGKEVTIKSDNTYTSTASTFGYRGSYTINGNKITAKSEDGATFVITVEINGDRMVWNGTANNGVTFHYVFTRESTGSSTKIDITSDMIVGDFILEAFTLERGQNHNLAEGAIITFNDDGTCKGFNSMEDYYKIVDGRVETYYKKTQEPMFVYTLIAIEGGKYSVRMQGTLDDDFSAVLSLSKFYKTQTNSFPTEEEVISARNACYQSFCEFVESQLNLEKIRINKIDGENITPDNQDLYKTWSNAYTLISRTNLVLKYASEDGFGGDMPEAKKRETIAEIRAYRAFVYYNIAMLWGNVFLITDPDAFLNNDIKQISQSEVYAFAYTEIDTAIEFLPAYNSSELGHFTRDAGLALKAELQMTLGNMASAKSCLMNIDTEKYKEGLPGVIHNIQDTKNSILSIKILQQFNGSTEYYPVYTNNHLDLFNMEISGDITRLVEVWPTILYMDYGYWATLKRTSQAQIVTGCQDYELLMPIPFQELVSNPNAKQNPGY